MRRHMAFSESVKSKVRKKAHFRCCLCHELGVEVHHIIPQEENGADSEDNAAPLCPSCHGTYGANPKKRKFIREARDLWYEICGKRSSMMDSGRLDDIIYKMKSVATKGDLVEFQENLMKNIVKQISSNEYRDKDCLSLCTIQTHKNLSMEETIAFLYLKDYKNRKISQLDNHGIETFIDLLLDKSFWQEEDLIKIRDDFISRFGFELIKKLCIFSLDAADIDWNGFNENDLLRSLSYLRINLILLHDCITLNRTHGYLSSKLDRTGQFYFRNILNP